MEAFFWLLASGMTAASLYRIFLLLGLTRRKQIYSLSSDFFPRLAVQLPLYNERAVAARLLDAVSRLDYPRERLEIQVLDDSTDETTLLVQSKVQELLARGLNILHLRRASRDGFKAGALAHGLGKSQAEFFAIFDADFIPPADFLMRLVPHFKDDRVGLVQARWTFLNGRENFLTRLQSTYLNAHFAIEHEARSRSKLFFHFNGTAGIWRRKAIETSGGWSAGTLTEDLDLSYRAHLKGWEFRYCRELEVPSELPSTVAALKSQQYRWVKGMAQVACKQLPSIWRSSSTILQKADATFHLLSGGIYLQTLGICFLLFLWDLKANRPWGMIWGVNLLMMSVYFALGNFLSRKLTPRSFFELLGLFSLGVALSVNGARATLSGWFGRQSSFERTPKRGHGGKGYPQPADPTLWFEGCLAVSLALIGWGVQSFFAAGFAYLTFRGLKERWASY